MANTLHGKSQVIIFEAAHELYEYEKSLSKYGFPMQKKYHTINKSVFLLIFRGWSSDV